MRIEAMSRVGNACLRVALAHAAVPAFLALALIGVPASAAATLQVNGTGQLTGATGVNVSGTLYDVEFVEGTCVDLFGGCDESSDFTFTTQADAQAAA